MEWAVIVLIAIIAVVYLLIKKGGRFKVSYRGLGQQLDAEYEDRGK